MKKLFLLLLTMATIAVASAQTRTVTGQVVYAGDGEPLVGATVMPVGGGNGIATDIDGEFTLKVPASCKKLRVSYVGMLTQDVDITGEKLLIKLTNTENRLDEVMVVAYGTAKKAAFTGSAAVIDASTIEQQQVTNALDALGGKVAGVQISNATGMPGSNPSENSMTMRIRGISSINAGNSPLIVVDGAPFTGDVSTLNTNDIESMTVLKDAASNALYGARGANGVVLITTKRGKAGQSARVTLDAKWGSNSKAVRDYDYVTDPGMYYQLFHSAIKNYAANVGGYDADRAYTYANNNLFTLTGYNTFTVPEGENLILPDGSVNPKATPGRLATYRGQDYWLQPDDWMDAVYKHGLRQEYNFSVTNGTEQTNFFASAGYLKNEGITQGSDYERFTGRLAADTQARPWLKVGANLSYTNYRSHRMSDDGTSNSSGNIFAAAQEIAPIYPIYVRDGQGNIMKNAAGYEIYDYGEGENAGLKRPIFGSSNALSSNRLDTNTYNGNAVTAQGYVEIRFLKDFKFTSNNSANLNEWRTTYTTNPFFGSYASSNGILSKEHNRMFDYTFQQLLNWNHVFGKHDVSILLGHENYWRKTAYLYASKSNMFDYSNQELAGAIVNVGSDSYTTEYDNEGWFFRGQYDYAGKYFGSASFRRDGSSRFHKDHRWGNFWSVGGAWIISQEDWFDAQWVNMLKVKASYGEQGNDNIGNFRYTNTYTIANASGHPAAVPSTLGNPEITWEKNGNLNVGVEFDLFNSRLGGSVEGFYRHTSDMLSWFSLPGSYGYTGYYDNVGNMMNAGIEVELNGTVVATRDFTWDLHANFTWYKNKITKIADENKTMKVDGVGGYSSGNYFYGEGEPMYTYHMKRYAGVNDQGEALYYVKKLDSNGEPTGELDTTTASGSADYFLCGTALAPVYGGFGTSLSYKGFDLSIDFNYQLGGQVYDSDYARGMASPTSSSRGQNFHKDILNAWTPENSTVDIPRLQYNDQYTASASDRFLTSARYLSLQNINFGYSLPQVIVRKLGIQNLRFYFSADNVAVWSARKGLDPRQSLSGSVNGTYYAPIRTLSGGLNVQF